MKYFFLVLSLTFFQQANAKMLRGDWESYGDLPEPYNPTYLFQYDCQAELSDLIERAEKNSKFKVYALAKFSLTNGKDSKSSENLMWTWLKTDESGEETIIERPKKSFAVKRHTFAIKFSRGETKADQLQLFSQLFLPAKDFLVPHDSSNSYSRDNATLTNSNVVDVYSINGKIERHLKSYLECEKIK